MRRTLPPVVAPAVDQSASPHPVRPLTGGNTLPTEHPLWVLGWALPLILQVAHALVMAPTYHVGSFDDDANYLMAAHVLAHGGGLTAQMQSGTAVVAEYLPGYPALLVPVIWLFGNTLWAPRALSLLCTCALYPLFWRWMAARGVRPWARVGVLGLVAMNLVLATYATMVMAEAPFLVVLVLALLALERMEHRRTWAWAGVVAVLMAEMIWLKEAAAGLAVGLGLYLLWRRRWANALVVSAGTSVLVLPGLMARWSIGASTLGTRYAGEISDPVKGGFLHQLPSEVVDGLWAYLKDVMRQSVLPSGSPLPNTGVVHALVSLIGASVPIFVALGAVAWYRRHPRPEMWMVGAYFVETLGYPFVNQRRVLLVLPLVTLLYVVGAGVAARFVLSRSRRVLSRTALAGGVVLAVLAAEVPTAFAFGTNYLYSAGEQGAEFARSPAMAMLASLGSPDDVVETDYRGTVAYFTGHRTRWSAFARTTPFGPLARPGSCTSSTVGTALAADQAAYLVIGDFNIPGVVDSPCLLHFATEAATPAPTLPATSGSRGRQVAARLLSTSHDDTSVFELLGSGTAQAGLVDRTLGPPTSAASSLQLPPNGQGDADGTAYSAPARGGQVVFQWDWGVPAPVTQVSLGSASALGTSARAPVVSTVVSVLEPGHGWQVVTAAPGGVGDRGSSPYLLADLPPGTHAEAARVIVRTLSEAEVSYLNVIGPRS